MTESEQLGKKLIGLGRGTPISEEKFSSFCLGRGTPKPVNASTPNIKFDMPFNKSSGVKHDFKVQGATGGGARSKITPTLPLSTGYNEYDTAYKYRTSPNLPLNTEYKEHESSYIYIYKTSTNIPKIPLFSGDEPPQKGHIQRMEV